MTKLSPPAEMAEYLRRLKGWRAMHSVACGMSLPYCGPPLHRLEAESEWLRKEADRLFLGHGVQYWEWH